MALDRERFEARVRECIELLQTELRELGELVSECADGDMAGLTIVKGERIERLGYDLQNLGKKGEKYARTEL